MNYTQIGTAAAELPEMTLTESITNSLQSLLANLNDTAGRLQDARDRTFGALPEASQKDGPRPLPNGRANEINMLLGACHETGERCHRLALELLRRV